MWYLLLNKLQNLIKQYRTQFLTFGTSESKFLNITFLFFFVLINFLETDLNVTRQTFLQYFGTQNFKTEKPGKETCKSCSKYVSCG